MQKVEFDLGDQPVDMDRKVQVELTYGQVMLMLHALLPFATGGLTGGTNAREVGIRAATLGVVLSNAMLEEVERLRTEKPVHDGSDFVRKTDAKGDNDATKDS